MTTSFVRTPRGPVRPDDLTRDEAIAVVKGLLADLDFAESERSRWREVALRAIRKARRPPLRKRILARLGLDFP